MAVERIGSVEEVNSSVNASSASITVPGDCTFLVVDVNGFEAVANYFSGGTLTLNGVGMTATVAANSNTGLPMLVCWTLVSPATGSQTLAWDWTGAGAPDEGVVFACSYYKNVDSIRDSVEQSTSGNLPASTGTLTAVTGDLIHAAMGYFSNDGGTSSWTNATEVFNSGQFNFDTLAVAEASPSGDTEVTAGSNPWGSAIAGLVLVPTESGLPAQGGLIFLWASADPDATVIAVTVNVVAAIPAVTKTASVEKAATTINGVAAVPTPTTIGGTTVTPSSVNAVAAIPAATVTASSTKTATTVDAVAQIPAVTKTATALTTPATINTVASIPAVTKTASVEKIASSVAGVTSIPAATTTAAATKNAVAVNVVAVVPSVTTTATALVLASTVNAVGIIPQAAAQGEGAVTVMPATVSVDASVPPVLVISDVTKQAVTVSALVTIPATSHTATATVAAATVTLVAGIPLVTVTGPPVIFYSLFSGGSVSTSESGSNLTGAAGGGGVVNRIENG